MNKRTLLSFAAVLATILLISLTSASCGGGQQEAVTPTAGQAAATPTVGQEAATPPTLDGQALVQERCTQCHGLGRITRAEKTEEEWQATVERMVGKGAALDAAEQEAVIRYLAETYSK